MKGQYLHQKRYWEAVNHDAIARLFYAECGAELELMSHPSDRPDWSAWKNGECCSWGLFRNDTLLKYIVPQFRAQYVQDLLEAVRLPDGSI